MFTASNVISFRIDKWMKLHANIAQLELNLDFH